MVFLLPTAAPKKLDIDFIPFLSTLDNDFCAAVNFVLVCNKTKSTKKNVMTFFFGCEGLCAEVPDWMASAVPLQKKLNLYN